MQNPTLEDENVDFLNKETPQTPYKFSVFPET
jgi:hypothetical protein